MKSRLVKFASKEDDIKEFLRGEYAQDDILKLVNFLLSNNVKVKPAENLYENSDETLDGIFNGKRPSECFYFGVNYNGNKDVVHTAEYFRYDGIGMKIEFLSNNDVITEALNNLDEIVKVLINDFTIADLKGYLDDNLVQMLED